MTSEAEENSAPQRVSVGTWGRALFAALMLTLTGVFAALGLWQLDRLQEKETLIAAVSERFDQPPVQLPPVAEWVGFDAEVYDFRPVTLTGRFDHEQTILVFTSLSSPRGQYRGAGYWVVAPFLLTQGGAVFVNRGFVPQQLASGFARGGGGEIGEVTLTGIARRSETVTGFTPLPDVAKRVDYLRNVERLASMVGGGVGPFAPIYVDVGAGAPGSLPQGGETVMEFPNNHFGYALTWFGFAVLTPIMLVFWLVRQWRPAARPKTLP